MAASMLKILRSSKCMKYRQFEVLCRTYLTDAYRCNEQWQEYINAKLLQDINPKTFGYQILEKFEETKQLSYLDIDMFASQIHRLQKKDEYIAREILIRFRHNNICIGINDTINHALVRNYMAAGWIDQLLELMRDKSNYGIFPDYQCSCILIDHLLDEEQYPKAAKVAYEVMLQEDFEHPLLNLLSLSAVVKHYSDTMTFERYQPPPIDPDEEPEYVVVKIVRNPYYDDHFDIKDERFLMGKTLYKLGSNMKDLTGPLSRSLQLIGLGLYEKFDKAHKLVENWLKDETCRPVVFSHALESYTEYLNDAPTRDANAEPKPMGEKTLDDEVELLKLTQDEKNKCLEDFKPLKERLLKGLTSNDVLSEEVERLMWTDTIAKLDRADSEILAKNYAEWRQSMETTFKEEMQKQERNKRMENIQARLEALQKREELMTYFDNIQDINWYQRFKKDEVKEHVEKEVYVEAPGERNIAKPKKGRK